MPIVIPSPLIETDRRRHLPVAGSEPSHRVGNPSQERVQCATEKTGAGLVGGVQENLNQDYVERLKAETNAALVRSNSLEQELNSLKEQLESERKAARERGYKEGFQQAIDQVAAEQAKGSEAIVTLLNALSKEQCHLINMAEDAAVEIGFAAAVKIMGQASVDHSLAGC